MDEDRRRYNYRKSFMRSEKNSSTIPSVFYSVKGTIHPPRYFVTQTVWLPGGVPVCSIFNRVRIIQICHLNRTKTCAADANTQQEIEDKPGVNCPFKGSLTACFSCVHAETAAPLSSKWHH